MPYDEALAERIRPLLAGRQDAVELKMFGGLGFTLRGHMCVGVWKDSLIARLGVEQYEDALEQPFVGEFDITGRPMRGWVLIAPEGIADDATLSAWIERAVAFVGALPPK